MIFQKDNKINLKKKYSKERINKVVETRRKNNSYHLPEKLKAWNKGLTKETHEGIKRGSIKISNSKKGKIPENMKLLHSPEIIKKSYS